ncbi:MAG: TolC family protein [Acidobacteria bacterium]|nr:TolC family protein [Acidobacteriota bacterium]
MLVACATLAGVLLPVGVGAQTLSLTESQALARLSIESPRVQAVLAAVDVARAEVLAAGRWPNPRLTYNRESVVGVSENMFLISQVLPLTGRRGLDVRAASQRVEAVSSRVDDEIRRLRADLRLAFSDLWAAQTRERELVRSRDRLRDLAEVLGRREAAGESAGFDRLRADREAIDVEADRAAAATERARAQAALVSFFPSAPDGIVEAVATVRQAQIPPPLGELIVRAEAARPALLALGHELEAAALAERAAGRRALPEPELVAGTKSSNAGTGDIGTVVSVHVSVPLFDRARPERAAAVARAAQVRAETERLRLDLRAQIAGWRDTLMARRDSAAGYRTAVTANAEEIERIALVSYDAGERGILELLDAYRVGASARVRQTTLDRAVREAEIELEFVSGWEIP